jgi:protein-L-isoaspartate(D-aspartate) O-methyltransferase
MTGWRIPPPQEPTKNKEDFAREREAKVNWLAEHGYLQSERIRQALLAVPRENFLPRLYRDCAYQELPFPLPGKRATISCPHSYPLFYERLGMDAGHRFLEIGTGSGYGAAVAWEVVGPKGLVVSVEIDPVTLAFARRNLQRAGYADVVVVCGDGGQGYPERSPYDCIAVTAACSEIPTPLVQQLAIGGRLAAPRLKKGEGVQELVLLEKGIQDVRTQVLCEVLYVPLQGTWAR